MSLSRSLKHLEGRLGHRFASAALLELALTHRSRGNPNNERLEFLGDSLLNCVVAELLYVRFPQLPEGDLSRLRASLVKAQTLADLALSLQIGDDLLMGEGELKSGGFRRPSILADSLEALFGAVYLDAGFAAVHKVISTLFGQLIASLDWRTVGKDPKTLLQEHLQARHLPLPCYTVLEITGDAHAQSFHVECVIEALAVRAEGTGHSRRAAEQEAASIAYHTLTAT